VLEQLELEREGEGGEAEVGAGQLDHRREADVGTDQAMSPLDPLPVDRGRHRPSW